MDKCPDDKEEVCTQGDLGHSRKTRKDTKTKTKCRHAREGANSVETKTQMYNRDEDSTEAKTQFETPNAKVHSDGKSHDAQIKREDCNPEAIGASNTAPMLPTRVLKVCSKGPQRPHKS